MGEGVRMLRESLRLFQRFYRLVDAVWIALAWILAYWIRFSSGLIPVYFGVPPFETYVSHLPLVLLAWMAALSYGGVYRTDRWWNVAGEWRALARSSAVAMVLLVSIIYLSTKTEISRIFYVCFLSLAFAGLLTIRRVLRGLFRRTRSNGSGARRVLVVGDNAFVTPFCENVKRHPETGLLICGQLLAEDEPRRRGALQVLGDYSAIRDTLRKEGIHIVVFTLPLEHGGQLKEMLRDIDELAVDILVIPDEFPVMPLHPGIEEFGGVPLVRVRASPQQGTARLEKRIMDVIVSGTALVLLAPLFLVIGLLIKATSPGPVFYRQARLGMDGRAFLLVKFRTMRKDAERENEPVWSMRADPRRTRLGAFLRKYSMDELPQLWNVLKGEMSLVGPRPERPEFTREFQKAIPAYILRQKVKSGLTGLAQVRGWRGPTSLEKRVECDIQYIEGWSLGLDLKILWLTLWKGFVNRAEQ
jgi:Undecaprenyl-phosphate glucose phosphotransferase